MRTQYGIRPYVPCQCRDGLHRVADWDTSRRTEKDATEELARSTFKHFIRVENSRVTGIMTSTNEGATR